MPIELPSKFEPLFTPSRYKASWSGRGAGKSHSFAEALVIRGAQKPLQILCCREIQKSIRDSVKRLIDDKIRDSGLSGFYKSTDTEVKGKNGTLFTFAGLRTNPESIKSTEGIDIAWCFVAGTLIDGKPIEEVREGDLVSSYNHFKQKFNSRQTLGIELGAMYWHFLDFLWVYLFLFLYFFK